MDLKEMFLTKATAVQSGSIKARADLEWNAIMK